VIDAAQTLKINSDPDLREANPVLNAFMSKGKAQGALATAAYFGAFVYAVEKLPNKYDPLINALSVVQLGVVSGNASMGINLSF
jgi:hypothetical protein